MLLSLSLFTTCLLFICIYTGLAAFISVYVCLNCGGRLVTKVVRPCDPPLSYADSESFVRGGLTQTFLFCFFFVLFFT